MAGSIYKKFEKERDKYLELLYKEIASFNSPQDVEKFLDNIFTEDEKDKIAKRLIIAKMVLEGKSYTRINDELGASHETISCVKTWLTGQPYRKTAKKRKKKEERQTRADMFPSASWLRKKYPLHHLFANLLKGD